MSYKECEDVEFFYFSEEEHTFIKEFLESKVHTYEQNTVCGDCCGVYASEYWVNGIFGTFPEKDRDEFIKLMEEKGYECSVEDNTISAEPDLSTSK